MAKGKSVPDPLREALASAALEVEGPGVTSAPQPGRSPNRHPDEKVVLHPDPTDSFVVAQTLKTERAGKSRQPRSTGLYGPRENIERRWLEWLARLADEGESVLSARDWSIEFRFFVGFATQQGWIDSADFDSGEAFSFPRRKAREVVRLLKTGVDSFLKQSEWQTPPLRSVKYRLTLGEEDESAKLVPYAGTFRDAIVIGMLHLLGEHGHRLRRCAAASCVNRPAPDRGCLFFAARRQRFCCDECNDREAMRNFIEKHGGPEKYSQWRAEKRKARLAARPKQHIDPVIEAAHEKGVKR